MVAPSIPIRDSTKIRSLKNENKGFRTHLTDDVTHSAEWDQSIRNAGSALVGNPIPTPQF